ncbi:uncharacterized protein EI90DRAFT_3094545 [Cantharellus anzutake]|uniref:uncharacterized protein n=1 Tax=Cantharellus anzutake TaxID=1750568 RepID=UPI001903A9DF|nr:uncharacterized protein EI90DRAFT_3094545 [Cantharellus anzutake]KAF8312151.1 hypothetical protein EI90DRAFT_3094545 [Cantharellus anzutake]
MGTGTSTISFLLGLPLHRPSATAALPTPNIFANATTSCLSRPFPETSEMTAFMIRLRLEHWRRRHTLDRARLTSAPSGRTPHLLHSIDQYISWSYSY